MQEKTFEWGGAVFTVKPATIRMHMAKGRLQTSLQDAIPDVDFNEVYWYVRACIQTTIEGDLSWQIPQNGIVGEELRQSFDDFYETLPESLFTEWFKALIEADAPYVSDEFTADVELNSLDPKD